MKSALKSSKARLKTEYVVRMTLFQRMDPMCGPMYLTKKGWGTSTDAIIFPTKEDADQILVNLEFLAMSGVETGKMYVEVLPLKVPR